MPSKTDLPIGEISRRTGLPISTIHFYEEKGLIESWRTNANHRRYGRDVLRKLSVIKVAQKSGIPLKEIKAALATVPNGEKVTQAHWARLSAAWREDLTTRIAQLQKLRESLDHCIGCGCLSLDHCLMFNPEDELSQQGSGPRLLDLDP